MHGISSLILASLLILPPAAHGSANPTGEDKDVAALIDQLGDADWQRRQAAQDRLVLMGRAVQPRLETAARQSPDPEVRALAEAALAQIAENLETGPSIITIRGSDIPLREMIKQLSEQAGAALEVYPPDLLEQQRDARVTLDIDHQPFWDAMRQITERTGFSIQQWDNSGVKLMQGGAAVEGIGQVSGPFHISAVRASRSRSIELGGAHNAYEDFHVQLSARAEPKLRLLRVGYTPNLREAVDELGNSLLPPDGEQHPKGYAMAPAGVWQATARLSYPPNAGKRIARLQGTIDVSIQTRYEQLEVPDIISARSVNKVAGGVRFIIRELRRSGESWGVDIVARPEGAAPHEWERIQQVLSVADIRLLDDHGESFQRTGYSSSGGPEQIEMSIEFSARAWGRNRKLGEPSKLVWTVPTATKDVSVPFDFRDLPIP